MSVHFEVILFTGIYFVFFGFMWQTKAAQQPPVGNRLLYSKNATPHAYPMVVAITNTFGDIYCTGSILNPYWVLTSVTCFDDVVDYESKLIFVAGAHALFNAEGTEQRARGIKFIPHERFTKAKQEHNIALVKIHPPFRLNRYVTATNLPTCNSETDVVGRYDISKVEVQINDLTGVECGFGRWAGAGFDNDDIIPILHERDVNLFSVDKCVEYFENAIIADSVICGSGAPCLGDDGMPLFFRDKNGRLIQIGLARKRFDCNPPHPYIRISKYLDWFNAVLTNECEIVPMKLCSDDKDCRRENSNECCDEHPSYIVVGDLAFYGFCRDKKYARKCRP